jgi:hypothetical protein
MYKCRKRIDDGRQLTIFDQIQELKSKKEDDSGSLKVKDDLQRALNNAIKKCPLSRHLVAGQMSHLLDEEITKAQIDSWTAESRDDRHIPAEFLPAFCKATGNYEALDVLNRKAGLFAMEGAEAVRSEIHRMREESRILLRECRKREELLETYKNLGAKK